MTDYWYRVVMTDEFGDTVACTTPDHANAVAFAEDIFEHWWGGLRIDWIPAGWDHV